jgi:hypothetical protein
MLAKTQKNNLAARLITFFKLAHISSFIVQQTSDNVRHHTVVSFIETGSIDRACPHASSLIALSLQWLEASDDSDLFLRTCH